MHEIFYAPTSRHRLSAGFCAVVGGRCVVFCLNQDFCDYAPVWSPTNGNYKEYRLLY